VQAGGTPKAGFIDRPGIPFLKVYNIIGQKIDFNHRTQFVTESIHQKELRKSIIVPGDVLMNIVGPPLGKVAIVPEAFPEWNANQALTIFRPSPAVISRWIYYFLCGGSSVQSVINETRGSAGQVNISLSQCRTFEFPLPPAAEQCRIVAKLDALSARLVRARAELNCAHSLASKIRLSALRSVFQFAAEKMPPGWSLKRFDEVADIQLGRQRSPKDHSGPHMRPYLRAANITWKGWDLTDVKEMNFTPTEFGTFRLKDGDVLLNEGSGSAKEVGKPAVWRGQIANVCFQNTLLRVRPFTYDSDLLRYCLLYLALSGQFVANTKGVNIIHIGKAGLARFMIPEPPATEQKNLLERLNIAFARADRLETEAARCCVLLDRLESAILAKAFKGELVPQDPNDEPASVSLDRIRAQRTTDPKPKRGCSVAA
jgi:type I restriction enzyme S subunit